MVGAKILNIIKEYTQTPEIIYIKGEYDNKPFGMNYYYSSNKAKISGDFTKEEQSDIIILWLNGDYV